MSKYANRLIAQAKAEGWKRLHLGFTGINGCVPPSIWELEALEELILGGYWHERVGWEYHYKLSPNVSRHGHGAITSLPAPPLSVIEGKSQGLQKLRLISLAGTKINDFSPLRMMRGLTELDVSGMYWDHSKGELKPSIISFLPRPLKSLNVIGSNGVDQFELAGQVELEVLRVNGYGISKAHLSGLRQLRYLEVDDRFRPFHLDELPELPALEALHCHGSRFSGKEAMKWLPRLKAIWLRLPIRFSEEDVELYVEAFRQAVHLQYLEIRGWGDFDLSHLKTCVQLRTLHLNCRQPLNIQRLPDLALISDFSLSVRYQDSIPQLLPEEDLLLSDVLAHEGPANIQDLPEEFWEDALQAIGKLLNLNALRISGLALHDLVPFWALRRLEKLSIFDSKLVSLSGIEALESLQDLNIGHANLVDIQPIQACSKLKSLALASLPLHSLSGIEGASLLKSLDLCHCEVRDLAPLSTLAHLEVLSCNQISASDFSPIRNCQALHSISLYEVPIHDLEPISTLPKLHFLALSGNPIKDLTPLEPWFRKWAFADLPEDEKGEFLANNASSLKVKNPPGYLHHRFMEPQGALNFWDWQRALAGEAEFPWRHGVPIPPVNQSVVELILNAHSQKSIRLDLGAAGIIGTVPDEIWGCAEILELNFATEGWSWWEQKTFRHYNSGNNISDFPMPSGDKIGGDSPGLPRLRGLNLSGNPIQRLDFLSWMPALQVLEIKDTLVKDVRVVFQLPYLEVLDIRGTLVDDLNGIENLTRLRLLYLDDTQVSDLSPLKSCPSLEEFTYSRTPAADLEGKD